jgi:hypothetical protein
MKTIKRLIIINLCLVACCAVAQERHTAQITIHVSDDADNAVSGIMIAASTFWRHIPGEGFGSGEDKILTGKTDTNGFVTFLIPCAVDYGTVSMRLAYGTQVPLTGYYCCSSGGIIFTNVVDGKWQPWNPLVELRVDRIVNPVPMYARNVRDRKIPEVGTHVGFDLLVGDWVEPFGQGKTPDFVFRVEVAQPVWITNWYLNSPRPYALRDDRLTLTFANRGDGIQPAGGNPHAGLLLPRLAPTNGYEPTIAEHKYDKVTSAVKSEIEYRHYTDAQPGNNYFFRVRTKMNENGNITNALYGKIYGKFSPDFEHKRITFTYYIDPDSNSRNMEFDPKQNLFTNLPPLERVSAP